MVQQSLPHQELDSSFAGLILSSASVGQGLPLLVLGRQLSALALLQILAVYICTLQLKLRDASTTVTTNQLQMHEFKQY